MPFYRQEQAQAYNLDVENQELRRVMKIALNAINGHLSMAYSSAESTTQLRAVRDEMRVILKD
jgi:hypothetical protein